MRARFASLALALMAALAAAPLAHATPTNAFPPANANPDGSETLIGNQDNKTVLFALSTVQASLQNSLFPSTPPAGECVQTGSSTPLSQVSAPCVSLSAVQAWLAKQNFLAATSGAAGVNIGQGSAGPTNPANGDLWLTPSGVFARVNGVTAALGVTVPTASAAGSTTQMQYNCSSVLCGASFLTISGTTETNSGTLTLSGTLNLPGGGVANSSSTTLAKPLITAASIAGGAGLNVPPGVAPTAPNNGDAWTNSTALFVRLNGVTQQEAVLGLAQTYTAAQTFSGGITGPLTENGLLTVKDSGGTNTGVTAKYASGGIVTILNGSSVGLSNGGASQLDVGNGTAGDISGSVFASSFNASAGASIILPLVSGGITSEFTPTIAQLAQALRIDGPWSTNQLVTIPANGAYVGFGGYANVGMLLSGSTSPAAATWTDPTSFYKFGHQIALLSSVGGNPFIVANVEAGQSDNQAFEIGDLHACSQMLGCVAQLYRLDSVYPAGSVSNYVIDTSGTLYTQATTSVSISVHCSTTDPSGLLPLVNDTTGQVTGIWSTTTGVGCGPLALTINSSGSGSGATAHPVIVSATTDAMQGPTDLWNQAFTNVTGPGSQMGLGNCDITRARCMRLGAATNTGAPWISTLTLQPTLATGGCFEVDTGAGTGNLGFTGGVKMCDAGSGVAQFLRCLGGANNDCLTTDGNVGIKTGFVRYGASTVAGLSTLDGSPADGDTLWVTDASNCASRGSAPTGGGSGASARCLASYNGAAAAWQID